MKVRVPASSANLGPGFDTLGLALSLYVTVEVHESDSLSLVAVGHGSDLVLNDDHLAVAVARSVLGHSNLAISIESQIPLARGLGSSAAVAVAVAAACGAYDAFVVASDFDGHSENAGASYLGGLVAGARIDDGWELTSLTIDPRISAILIIPETELSTTEARSVLPAFVSRNDAVFNLGRLAFLLAGLADVDQLKAEFGQDRIHEQAREKIFPAAAVIKELLRDNGARLATWSGAGTAMLGLFDRGEADSRLVQIRNDLSKISVPAQAVALEVDFGGLTILDDSQ